MRRFREPFDIDAWWRRHPAGQPFPRVRNEPTRPMNRHERVQALRDERRQELAAQRAKETERRWRSGRAATERDHEWARERDRLWDEHHTDAMER